MTVPPKIAAVLRGAAVAVAGAVLTYAAEYLATGNLAALGAFGPIAAAAVAILINAARKALTRAEKGEPFDFADFAAELKPFPIGPGRNTGHALPSQARPSSTQIRPYPGGDDLPPRG
ncbi:MAG: hypothetical protein M3P94_01465 [Chloroflexota bacterium]|nr:hypothetical protein [Chloroflexota bacterium]